jgi:hypothetical protein
MATPFVGKPLRETGGADESPESPEALFISALLDSGQFNPEHYHIKAEDLSCWGRVFAFGVEHQQAAGRAPGLEVVKRKFPRFEVTRDIDPRWAAGQLSSAAAGRTLRTAMQEAIQELNDEDVDAAYATFAGMSPPRRSRAAPVSVFDHNAVEERFDIKRIEVPYPALGRATGGIGEGEFWLFGARLGAGKTHVGIEFAKIAAKLGYKVGIASLEMPARQVVDRVLKHMCGSDLKLLMDLEDGDLATRKKAVDIIQERIPGTVEVLDPSHGDVHSTVTIQEVSHDYDLLIIDHVGLMKDNQGRRAIDDWRVQALISNTLREITLATNSRIFGLVQTNRESDTDAKRAPKASQLSQADALGQDCDVLITAKRVSDRVMLHEAVKVREGPNVRWNSRFDPVKNAWYEITKDEAIALEVLDNDKASAV